MMLKLYDQILLTPNQAIYFNYIYYPSIYFMSSPCKQKN